MGIFDGVLLATDVDGTLLNSKSELTENVRTALTFFVSEGGLFTVATGRSLTGFTALRPSLPLSAPAIMSNGAYIYDYATERELHAEWLTGPFEAVLDDIRQTFPGLGTELHWPDRVCIMDFNHWNDVHMKAVKSPYELIKDPADAPPPWFKLLFVDEHETLRAVADYAEPKYKAQFSFFFSAPCLLEVQNAGVDKANGVRKLAELLSLVPKHIYTAGDAGNDLGMLRAYESFAPASASEEALAAATHTVPGCDEDAIAEVIDFLKKRYI